MKIQASLRTIPEVNALLPRTIPEGAKILVRPGQELKPETIIASAPAGLPGQSLRITSGFWGRLESIGPNLVTIASLATIINTPTGFGQYNWGLLKILPRDKPLSAQDLDKECLGKILVGSVLTEALFVVKAAALGAVGLVVGSADYKDFRALTNPRFPILITEGFGDAPIAEDIRRVLRPYDNRYAALHGDNKTLTIALPWDSKSQSQNNVDFNLFKTQKKVRPQIGARVRLIGDKLGQIGRIKDLPRRKQTLLSGLEALTALVEVKGQTVSVPLPNLEILLSPSMAPLLSKSN